MVGGVEEDLVLFKKNTASFDNVSLIRKTSGEASRSWKLGPVSFVFIDAVHDYVNTSFDIEAWTSKLVTNGIVAIHDTDDIHFAGTRRAAYEALRRTDLVAHVDNLVILKKRLARSVGSNRP